jgi:ABC-type lipoprotein export system ATPase subunit
VRRKLAGRMSFAAGGDHSPRFVRYLFDLGAVRTLALHEGYLLIALSGLRHAYNGKCVLELSQCRIAQGETWLVLGPSGSGKTTLLHILAGILRPSAGSVAVAGVDLGALRGDELDRFRGRHIGIVLQRLHLVGSLTVLNNLLLAQYLAGLPQDGARACEVLSNLGLGEKMTSYPSELSHGQAQRVALARAVINRPQLLLADEPTSNLDDASCKEAFDLLSAQASACNATMVIATHDLRIRERVTNRLSLEARP